MASTTSHHVVPLDVARLLTSEIAQAVNEILEQHGFDPASTKVKYGDRFVLTIESVPTSSDENGVNTNQPDVKAFLDMATYYGLQPTDLGKTFRFNSESYSITGLRPRSTKFPVLATRARDGKTYKFPAATVLAGLTRS